MEKGFQLRNYHIRRGSRPKDSTPLYPITKAENVIGGAGGVTQVTELPATGDEGKIYYNTTEKKYYVYNTGSGFKELGNGSNVLVDDVQFIYDLDDGNNSYELNNIKYRAIATVAEIAEGMLSYGTYTDNVFVLRDVTEEEFNSLVSNSTITEDIRGLPSDFQSYLSWLEEDDRSQCIYRVEYLNPNSVDTETIHYISRYRTWWKFETKTALPNQVIVKPVHLYTGTIVEQIIPQEVTIIVHGPKGDTIQTITTSVFTLNPSIYFRMTSTDNITFQTYNDIDFSFYHQHPLFRSIPIYGRFIAVNNNIQITTPSWIAVADNNPEILSQHVYEVRILDGVLSWHDVTASL